MGLCMVIPSALIRVSRFLVGTISCWQPEILYISYSVFLGKPDPKGLFPFGISGNDLPS